MTERELAQLVGRACLWTPHLSDEMGVHARIADAVLTPTDEILVLVIPLSGCGAGWVVTTGRVWDNFDPFLSLLSCPNAP